MVLRLYDVLTGRDRWKRTFPARSVVLDSPHPGLTGVVEPGSGVVVVDLEAHREVLRAAADRRDVDRLHAARVLRDHERYYIALEAADKSPGHGTVAVFGDLPSVPVNGMLYAFWREGLPRWYLPPARLAWFCRLPRQAVLTYRFDELPVVLCSAVTIRPDLPRNSPANLVATRSIEKRTGKLLFTRETNRVDAPYHTLRLDAYSGTVELIGPSFKLRHTWLPLFPGR